MRRRHFLTSSSAALVAGCAGTPLTGPQLSPTALQTVAPTASPAATVGKTPPTVATPTGAVRYADLSSANPAIWPAANAATGYSPQADSNALWVSGTPSPATAPIPGVQIVGSYGGTEQYVIRVPDAWNGKLVVAGTPALRTAFASDQIWGDFALANGYAYAASNKNVPYNVKVVSVTASPAPNVTFPIPFDLGGFETSGFGYLSGGLYPGTVDMTQWPADFAALTVAAQAFLTANYKKPTRTYAVGLSNGGMEVRWLAEQYPQLIDGAVEWSAVYISPSGGSFLDYMPTFLKNMPAYVASGFASGAAAAAIQAAGYPADITQASATHPSLWFDYYAGTSAFYTDLTVFIYALMLDPTIGSNVTGKMTPNATNPTQLPGSGNVTGMADPVVRQNYVPSSVAKSRLASIGHTGKIGKPVISIAGTADMFITPQNNATPYLNAVKAAGQGSNYWQYLVSGGTHVDTFAAFGYGLQSQAPFAWAAFNALVNLVENKKAPAATAGTQTTVATASQIA